MTKSMIGGVAAAAAAAERELLQKLSVDDTEQVLKSLTRPVVSSVLENPFG